ncbi:MAG: DUF5605 domain-containing protein [Clostridia bacterium]|nr:DUF5605 domain-containing protein [Clostridia bacterium]
MSFVERWKLFEISTNGKSDGNPFTDYPVTAEFRNKNKSCKVDGFYDGDGVYRVRFMPSILGEYEYTISSDAFDTITGTFTCTEASDGNHGPVRVCNNYHFAYEDGTPYYPFGTTCYVWELQSEELQNKTLEELAKGYFNKIRFCIFPKHYHYNLKEPASYPYEKGNKEGLDLEAVEKYSRVYPPVEKLNSDFNFMKLNPAYFRHIDDTIEKLDELGVEADIIVMHPYDRWGFSKMTKEADDLYWNYVIARYAAYKNVWWSLANEYDLMPQKQISDWERYAAIICEKDPYNHLRNIHNCMAFYDHTRPWITHCCLQRQDLYRHVEYTDEYRVKFGKACVWDEIAYEGNIDLGWGNISGQELTRRFWEACMRGGYAGHGETYQHPEDILWWSHGGELHGDSPARIKFLHEILKETPGHYLKRGEGMFDETVAVPESMFESKLYEIHYFGFGRPSYRMFYLPEDKKYQVEIIDTWEMTVKDAGVHSGTFRIELPGKEYMAVRIREI